MDNNKLEELKKFANKNLIDTEQMKNDEFLFYQEKNIDMTDKYTFTEEEIDTLFEMLCRVRDMNANEYSVYCKVREYFEEG